MQSTSTSYKSTKSIVYVSRMVGVKTVSWKGSVTCRAYSIGVSLDGLGVVDEMKFSLGLLKAVRIGPTKKKCRPGPAALSCIHLAGLSRLDHLMHVCTSTPASQHFYLVPAFRTDGNRLATLAR